MKSDRIIFVRRLLFAVVFPTILYGTAFFVLLGTWNWWRAWVLLGVIVAATVTMMLVVFRDRQELLEERFKGAIQPGQPWADRAVMLLFWIAYLTLLVFIPYDVFRRHVFEKPGPVTSSLGMLLILAGYWIVAIAFRENTFAAPVIKHQKERQHVVVDTGPYAIVRHPLYAGVVLLFIGVPLWLESYAGVLVALFPIAMLMLRLLVEERFLRRELAGYAAYTDRVRSRLVPFVW